ncbi:uncharacterized protein K452DRAFT_90057 [Aplosporella prunicola CBS 121167]|uniref:DUF676 domain-containing protein n=1 Tax=Aplosporella prunicola CBS 121167 TaxID=1176127 RepID=A0A6A6B2E1_9PEZI|nr:uncharacterized protein K452DRAFT_90057 [Aplosporella prunicola CBS 121167]KAF2138220.1 hypothetical protein K452DRAFT_90057 [Aplosporella prunicola CBS 121167]
MDRGLSKPVAAKAEAPKKEDTNRKDLASQTFRLQLIPASFEGHDTTEKDVQKLVREAYTVESDIAISVRSLARHHTRKDEKVATISFSETPLRLAQTPKSVQEFDCVAPFRVRLDINFLGLTPLHSHDNPESSLDIVALSGLNGHAFGSFKRKGGDYMWLRDDLCQSLPNARVFIYGYRTEMVGSDSFQSLEDLGLSFKSTLTALFNSNDSNRSPNPLVLIGHSLGGLVIKQTLCQMSENNAARELSILKSIYGIMFFGTPNQGMDISSLVPMVQGQSNEDFVRSLGLDSPELRHQANQWYRVFQAREGDKVASGLEIISFYETKNSPTAIKVDGKWKMGGEPAKLVDRNSATHGRPFDSNEHYVQPIDRNHSELVKFQSNVDDVYTEKVFPLLKGFYDTARNQTSLS